MRKICVVTATRAEYGLLKPLMDLIHEAKDFELQIIVTGAHLSPEFGLTYKQIETDGFKINEKVEILLSSDTSSGIVKTMGIAMLGLADVFSRMTPDLLVVLGDRYEMLAVTSAATIFKIPIVHLCGGELTEGAYDDAIRHAISKMSHLHFTATDEYRNRVIQMGENPINVFNVGAIGLDNIRDLELLTKEQLEVDLNIKLKKYNYQVTFHPETLSDKSSKEQFEELLLAIDKQKDSFFIFTKANADTDGRIINEMIDNYVMINPDKCMAYASLGTLKFLSVLKCFTAIVGNSSSGIVEAPSLFTATLNIGDRQKGRLQATSVVNVKCSEHDITIGFQKVRQLVVNGEIDKTINPYDNGGASSEILKQIRNRAVVNTSKSFYNL